MTISPKYRKSFNKAVGKKIQLQRRIKGFRSQAGFAEAVGADRVTVSRWESGASGVGPEYYEKVKEVLGVSDAWFFKGTPNPNDFSHGPDAEIDNLKLLNRTLLARIKQYEETVPEDILESLRTADENMLENVRIELGLIDPFDDPVYRELEEAFHMESDDEGAEGEMILIDSVTDDDFEDPDDFDDFL